jgi:uncharacterized membrane protein SirB2
MYAALKHLHILFAVLSITGFVVRGVLAIQASPLLQRPWLRGLPHINDTLLFAAGVALAFLTHQIPFVDAWITAKLAAVLLYIVLGFLALRRTLPAKLRLASGFGALAVVAYIVGVALTKNPLPFQ